MIQALLNRWAEIHDGLTSLQRAGHVHDYYVDGLYWVLDGEGYVTVARYIDGEWLKLGSDRSYPKHTFQPTHPIQIPNARDLAL
jgi:hypothetical protein